jgi:hypothetical protein
MKLFCFLSIVGISAIYWEEFAADKLLDGWYEVDRIVSVQTTEWQELNQPQSLGYDTAKKMSGDFSIKYRHQGGADAARVVFHPYPHSAWTLSAETSLNFWVHVESGEALEAMELNLEIRDQSGQVAHAPLHQEASAAGNSWIRWERNLVDFQGARNLDFAALTEVSIVGQFPNDLVLRVDSMHFTLPEPDSRVIGVTSKSVKQRMDEARASREQRAQTIYADILADDEPAVFADLFSQFWAADNLDTANRALERVLVDDRDQADVELGFTYTWHLLATPWILRMYFTFGPGEGGTHNRLSGSNQSLLLELLWERTKGKNDIHWARNRNPWIMDGSENHDINGIVSNYLSSYIFKDHPDFKNRIYPNLGKGGGAGYWFHRDRGVHHRFYGPYGRADLSDGRDYRPVDHYEAWGKVIRDVITSRMHKGFFLEQASPGYMKHTLGFLQDLYEFDGCERMRTLIGEFFDVVWIQWAFESLHGQRGGAKTRDHTVLNVEGDSMYQMARFLMGGFLTDPDTYYWLPAATYELPELVWRVALDREGLGEFALIARTIGEEPADLPRQPGLERSLNLNTEHRMFRYTWITPHSIMGAQMDHPLAVHSHLSPVSRLYGINFSNHPDARIFPHGVRQTAEDDWEIVRRGGPMYRAVQHEYVLVSQQSRGFTQVNPDWFPTRSLAPIPIGVYFSPAIDSIVEKEGWIFAQSGSGFAAVRIVEGAYMAGDGIEDATSFTEYEAEQSLLEPLRTDSYQWNRDKTLAVANNAFAGLVMETSSIHRHEDLNAFIEDVLDARLELQKTVVPGWYTLVYQGTGDAPLIEFNLSNNKVPRVDGVSIDYEPHYLFDSPYLRSVYDSGRIKAQFGGSEQRFEF